MAKNDFLFPKAGGLPLSQWAGGQLVGDEHKTGVSALYKLTPPMVCGGVTASPLKGAAYEFPEQEARSLSVRAKNQEPQPITLDAH